MASSLALEAQRIGGMAFMQANNAAGKKDQCCTRSLLKPASLKDKDSLLRLSSRPFQSFKGMGLASRHGRKVRLGVRADGEDQSDLSPRHLDWRHRKGAKEWFEQQPIQDRSQGLIRGKNWILRRGTTGKAVQNDEAVTEKRPTNPGKENHDRERSSEAGAGLAEYTWTAPAQKSLLDMARRGGGMEPLQIERATVETSQAEVVRPAPIGETVPEIKPLEKAKEGSDSQNWKMLIGLFFAFCLMTSADKAAMSVAPMSMAKQFGWLESDKGLIGSSFFFGFMFSQIPSSIVCKRIGRRKIMTGVALWFAACQLLTPLAASHSLTGLLAVRAALGFGEGVVVPILTSMLADYVPAEKRSSSLAMVFSGGPLGTVLSLSLCPSVIQSAGWPPLFYAIGVVALVWGAVWSVAAPHFEPVPNPKPSWNPFKRTKPAAIGAASSATLAAPSKLYKDSPLLAQAGIELGTRSSYTDSALLQETGVKLGTLAGLGPDGKRHPGMTHVTPRPNPDAVLNGAVLAASEEFDLAFSPDDPYWKLTPDARRKLRQRRIAIRGRFSQGSAAVSSPRKRNGIALPLPHSAQQSLSGGGHVAAPASSDLHHSSDAISSMSAEMIVAAARRRIGTPQLRPMRSTGTVCNSAAVSDALPAVAPATEQAQAPAGASIPWRKFFKSRAFWAIAGAHFCSNWGWNSFMAWLPTYFTQKLGLDMAASSSITLIPWMVAFLAGNTSGMLADWMSGLGIHKTKVRKIIQSIAFLGPALGLALLTRVTTATEAAAIFSAVLALGSFSAGGFCSNHSDISPKHSGTLYALTNTVGCLGGTASVALTGILLDKTGNWNIVWLGAALMYVIGTLWYVSLGSTEREFD